MTQDWYSDDSATMGDRISAAREGAGMTAATLARKLGVRDQTLTGWENDEREPRANQLRMLAGLTGVSLIWLLTGQGQGADGEAGPRTAPGREDALTELRALRQSITDAKRRLDRLEHFVANG